MNFFELFIGFRYLKAKKNQAFISFNTLLSIFIVFIGVFILILVISVMNGFQAQIKDKILDVDSHITVSRLHSEIRGDSIENYKPVVEKIQKIKGIKSVNPYIQGQGLLRHKTYINPVLIRGTGDKGNIPSDVKKFITQGSENFAIKTGVFIGEEMAINRKISAGESLELIVPKGKLTAYEGVLPGIGNYQVLGFFKTGYYDFDTKMIIMSLPDSQELFDVGDRITNIAVKVNDIYSLDNISSKIQSSVGFSFMTMTAEEKNHNLFYALRLEKLIMTIILFLIILSAGITIMGTLVMVVMEKRKAIGILKAMGAGTNSIMAIFVLEGFFIGLIGSMLGVFTGIAASLNLESIIRWVENSINFIISFIYKIFELGYYNKITIVPTHVYYIDVLPTQINPEFVVLISIFAVFLSTAAAIFPAWHASRLKPVEIIRYE